jgi:hypothetical protein
MRAHSTWRTAAEGPRQRRLLGRSKPAKSGTWKGGQRPGLRHASTTRSDAMRVTQRASTPVTKVPAAGPIEEISLADRRLATYTVGRRKSNIPLKGERIRAKHSSSPSSSRALALASSQRPVGRRSCKVLATPDHQVFPGPSVAVVPPLTCRSRCGSRGIGADGKAGVADLFDCCCCRAFGV